jgi:diamine N-acetyltransferase
MNDMPWKERLEKAELEEGLASSLRRASALVGELLPAIAPGGSAVVDLFDHMVSEVLDSETELLWWELCLDLTVKAAAGTSLETQMREAVGDLAGRLSWRLGPYEEVRLVPVTEDTVRNVCRLSDTLTAPKKYYVAHNAVSMAQAHFNPKAMFRAIYAGRAPIGFAMLVDDEDKPEYYLWRFMLAEPFHGRGLGRKAMDRLVEYVKSRPGAKEFVLSCGQGEGSPEGFYRGYGFVPGEVEDGELVMRLAL